MCRDTGTYLTFMSSGKHLEFKLLVWWNVSTFPHEGWSSVFVRPIKRNTWSHPSRRANFVLLEPSLKTSHPVPTNFQSSVCYITVINSILLNIIQDKSTQTKYNSYLRCFLEKGKSTSFIQILWLHLWENYRR